MYILRVAKYEEEDGEWYGRINATNKKVKKIKEECNTNLNATD